jgi:hypothetical protein
VLISLSNVGFVSVLGPQTRAWCTLCVFSSSRVCARVYALFSTVTLFCHRSRRGVRAGLVCPWPTLAERDGRVGGTAPWGRCRVAVKGTVDGGWQGEWRCSGAPPQPPVKLYCTFGCSHIHRNFKKNYRTVLHCTPLHLL